MIYVDNAATSFPKPQQVYDEVMNCMETYCANPGRSSHDMAIKAASKIMEAREGIRELFNISSVLNVIFTSNATEALNIGIKGTLKKGDHVISTILEHNSVLRPLNKLASQGVQLTLVGADEDGYINPNHLRKEIRKNTKLIVVNHVSNVTGTIQRIKEIGKIAREHGIIFMVDASQSAGAISIDVERDNIDILAFSGHKGLFGTQGTGGIYIRDEGIIDSFKEGGTGSSSNSMKQPEFLPDKFESGTLNTPGIAGLNEGIKFIKSIGRRNIQQKEEDLLTYLIEEISKMSYVKIYGGISTKNRGAVLSLNVDGYDSSEVGYILNKKGIAVRTGYHCAALIHGILGTTQVGTVRISPGYFNTYEEMEDIIKVLREIRK